MDDQLYGFVNLNNFRVKNKKVILLSSVADVIKYFKGDIPDYSEAKILCLPDDVRVTKELYLKSLQLMEEAKHIH